MRWTFGVQQQMKIAGMLGGIMAVLVIFNLILQKNISDIDRSVTSIYNDRLVPATDIFYLSENLHDKQLTLEKFLYQDNHDGATFRSNLKNHDNNIELLIRKFEKTKLVNQEAISLKKFKKQLAASGVFQNKIFFLAKANKIEARKLYESQGSAIFNNTTHQLSSLASIQSSIGNELLKDTRGTVILSNYLSDIQLVLAIVIGCMVMYLTISSKLVNKPQANFRWN